MSDKTNNIKLLQLAYTPEQVYPQFSEKSGKKYISYGQKNDYPLQLIELKNLSPMHSAIVSSIAHQVSGLNFKIVDDVVEPKLQSFIETCNSKGESLHDVFSKIIYDYILFGGWSSSIVWKKSQEMFELYHTDFSSIRSGKVDNLGIVNEFYFSENWKKSNPEYKEVNGFSTDKKTGTQLYYYKKYSPNNVYYPLPEYIGTMNWILLDVKISEFFNSYLDSGCFPSLAINYNNGIPDDTIKDQIYNDLIGEYQGSAKSGKLIVSFSEGKDTAPEIIPLNSNSDDSKFDHLSALVQQQILTGWKITSPELIGIQTAGKLGNASVVESQQLFFNSVIKPKQNEILKELNYLLKLNGFKNKVEIEQCQPIEFGLGEQSLLQVLTINEIRDKIGVEPLLDGNRIVGASGPSISKPTGPNINTNPIPTNNVDTPNISTN